MPPWLPAAAAGQAGGVRQHTAGQQVSHETLQGAFTALFPPGPVRPADRVQLALGGCLTDSEVQHPQ